MSSASAPQPAAPPVLEAEIVAPEPPEPPEQFGDAQWVKVFKTELQREVTLDEFVSDNHRSDQQGHGGAGELQVEKAAGRKQKAVGWVNQQNCCQHSTDCLLLSACCLLFFTGRRARSRGSRVRGLSRGGARVSGRRRRGPPRRGLHDRRRAV